MRTWAIIHLDRFLCNFYAVKAITGNRQICVPVKADAYGHGALKIAEISLKAGAFCLGVATVSEGTELRKEGIKAPILLMSQPHPQEIPAIINAELTPFVSDSWFAGTLNEQAKASKIKLSVHLKIDTGMGRIGCHVEEAPALAGYIADCSGLELTGTATHLAVSDSVNEQDIEYTQAQIASFKKAIGSIRDAGIDPGMIHAANSGAVILHTDAWFDMVRPGILLYGYKTAGKDEIPALSEVKPVMELRSNVVLIKKVKKGKSISYGRTWTAEQDTLIGVLPAGYGDGLPRLASCKWQAVIGGKIYPLVGRFSMDQCCVNLGPQTNVQRWDEAVIFGGSAPDAAVLAAVVGTIPYEITSNINKRVPRIYQN